MKDSRERFSATADKYEKYRPSYPAELIDWIVATAGLKPGATIADIGCGTGISTRLLAGRGFDVVGIDPNDDMLARAQKAGGARYQKGESTATGLPDGSVDLVTAAQAFHWFDIPKTLVELRRILKPPGWCAAFWNARASSPFLDAYEDCLRKHSKEYPQIAAFVETIASIKKGAGVTSVREAEFRNAQDVDRDGFFGRVYSSSYVAHGIADLKAFDLELNAIFDRHQKDGRVAFIYRSVVAAWRQR